MTDDHLTSLFAEGAAPERDASFVRSVDARIASARRGLRLRAIAVRVTVILILATTAYVLGRALEPVLDQFAGSMPQFMGVPLPLILILLAAAFVVRFRRLVRF